MGNNRWDWESETPRMGIVTRIYHFLYVISSILAFICAFLGTIFMLIIGIVLLIIGLWMIGDAIRMFLHI